MRPVPFEQLIQRIFSEYTAEGTIFGFSPDKSGAEWKKHDFMNLFGEASSAAVGPAAGPHTQLAQNITTAWLSGARFFELKTVQIMDTLDIPKPCIDAADEGFNTEWSSEFTLEKAYDEYLKGWFICHILEALLEDHAEKQFIFNMSVGYDLKGIQNPRMDRFINNLMDSSEVKGFTRYRKTLKKLAKDPDFIKGTSLEERKNRLAGLADRISPRICRSVTLSTMHGCPPDEIEKIARYLLTEKKLHTFIKLNPTLLTYPRVRKTLDHLGFTYVELKQESFDHDLQYPEAVAMLQRLKSLAEEQALILGVKLTNTLGAVNHKGTLPGEEMYMSGRALYPLSIQLALELSRDFSGTLPISFSGGASSQNITGLLKTGIRPVTMATELLKPGGYGRLARAVEKGYDAPDWNRKTIDVKLLEELVEQALSSPDYNKKAKEESIISTGSPLPLYDCVVAPCMTACPIGQDIPAYLKLVGEGRYAEALDVIYSRNPLPFVTGWICNHKCQFNCTRLDYEGSLKIREMKKTAAREGWKEYMASLPEPPDLPGMKTAIIGAGPGGIAAACFLRRGGAEVTVFEKEDTPGGVINHYLPSFRMPREEIEKDLDYIRARGVIFQFGSKDLTIEKLKARGYDKIIIATGAEKERALDLPGGKILTSLEFLKACREGLPPEDLGKFVTIVGGGNTAMDSARSAKRLPGVREVKVLYRRTQKEMPADREEYKEALKEGISFHFLRNPEEFLTRGGLKCTVMTLGDPDESGRRRPVPTEESETFETDYLITAIGEKPDTGTLRAIGLPVTDKGTVKTDPLTNETALQGVYLCGDALTGPQSIVAAMGGARKAADHILSQMGRTLCIPEPGSLNTEEAEELILRKSVIKTSLPPGENTAVWASEEASRCLHCDQLCNKCVDVCPNRANVTLRTEKGTFRQETQILHLDAFCNECGNCAQFCPWEGKPYKDKITLFSRKEDFDNSTNTGFLVEGDTILLKQNSRIFQLNWYRGSLSGPLPAGGEGEKTASVIRCVMKNYPWYTGAVNQ